MRVVAGKYRGRKLKAVPGKATRPTSDKVKESIFDRIGPYLRGDWGLDMYAGSGSLGIEAVSRGIKQVVLCERNRTAMDVILTNVAKTQAAEKFTLLSGPAQKSLATFANSRPEVYFDYVFLDPPYAKAQYERDMRNLAAWHLLNEQSMIICEMAKANELPETFVPFQKISRAEYGSTAVEIFRFAAQER